MPKLDELVDHFAEWTTSSGFESGKRVVYAEIGLSFKQTPPDSQQVRLDVIFAYIEQAQMENQAKDQIWAMVKKDMRLAYKMLELQGLGLEPELVAPVIELLVTE